MTESEDPPVEKPRHMHIATGSMSVEEAHAMARSFLAGRFEIAPLETDPPKLSGAADFWTLEHLMFTDNIRINVRLKRGIETSPGESVRFRLGTGGTMRGMVDGHETSIGEGDVCFDTYEAQFDLELEDFSCLAFGVASSAIGYDPDKHPPWILFDREDPAAQIFAQAARSFAKQITQSDAEEADRMGLAMLGLLRGLLEGTMRKSGRGAGKNRAFAMRRFIDENLSDPQLSTEMLLKEFPVSRSVIYREFANVGGVARFITSRRMSRARHMLETGDRSTKIADIAKQVGYVDQRHFSRQFGKYFGQTPSALVRRTIAQFEENGADNANPRELGQAKRRMLDGSEHLKRG